ncbi:snurportin-1-like [Anopheles albimanus]|uniref:Snurportin-1 n=1 Tax=Anopheles albimanus TaxID=7167 RepID=A0A182FD27_ANOAL|nr:snurportin-1-like [Anopheles albimanus]
MTSEVFKTQYKNYGRNEAVLQQERRDRLLEEQRNARQHEFDSGRPGLLEEIENLSSEDTEDADIMECQPGNQPNTGGQRRQRMSRRSKLYAKKLQFSEWMYERPEDLENWYAIPCPVGQRCLLVIQNKLAVAYDKRGQSIATVRTNIRAQDKRGPIVLDCILSPNHVFYILDVLVYQQLDLVQCECQLRFTWIANKFVEDDLNERFNAKSTLKKNRLELKLLRHYHCAPLDNLAECLSHYPAFDDVDTRLDGFLFYHKASHYVFGKTPLVTWLFPFMLSDVLQLPLGLVHQGYDKQRPATYDGNYAQYIVEFEKCQKNRKRKKKHYKAGNHPEDTMDTSNVSVELNPDDEALWEAMEMAPLDSDDEDLHSSTLPELAE